MSLARLIPVLALALCALPALADSQPPASQPAQAASPAQPAPQSMQTSITGVVTAVSPVMLTVRAPEHGPGLSHGPGIHSMAIVAARVYQIDITHAAYRKADGTSISNPKIQLGDRVTVFASAWQNGIFKAVVVTPIPQPAASPTPAAKP